MILNAKTFMACIDGPVTISTTGGDYMTIKTASGTFSVPKSIIQVNEMDGFTVTPKGGR